MMKFQNRLLVLFFVLASMTANGSAQHILINEFMASNNSGIQDEDGDFSDWIELFNSGEEADTLSGWRLTDDAAEPAKWIFPAVILQPGEYLLIFASGKDRTDTTGFLHTNFKLSASGEYLGLMNPDSPAPVSEFTPEFPAQYQDVSFGYIHGKYDFLAGSTPGAENVTTTYLEPPVFNKAHGFYSSPVEVELSTGSPGARTYYTLDASTPGEENGMLYVDPIEIYGSTIVRAMSVLDGVSSNTVTQTYLFIDDVMAQPRYPEGYPSEWMQPVNGTDEHEYIDSDYGMHKYVVENPLYSSLIKTSLEELPVISVVSDKDNFFSESTHPDSGGIYMYTGAPDGPTRDMNYHLGHGWTRPASIEFFNAGEENLDFQVNCGIKLHGGASRTPWKTAKHSFRLLFKDEYGPGKLRYEVLGEDAPNDFNRLILRGSFATRYGLQLYDPWMKSTFRDMGQYAAYSRFVHVYLNGMYWGIYNLCERMDDNAVSDHFGGQPEEYDIIKDYYEVEAGDSLVWEELVAAVKDNIEDTANYQRLLGNNADGTPNTAYEKLLDEVSLADYMLVNFYAGNTDWDHHNWTAARRKVSSEGFKFIPWDNEYIFRDRFENVTGTNNDYRPSGIFHNLMQNAQFRALFASRVNKHFFKEGALIPRAGYDRYKDWQHVLDTVILCESARWNSYTDQKSDVWEKSYHTFTDDYFPVRTEIVFDQLVRSGMYPWIAPPRFNTVSQVLKPDFELLLETIDTAGQVRYTLDGTDPAYANEAGYMNYLVFDGNPLPLVNENLEVKARTYRDGNWSTLTSREFIIEQEAEPDYFSVSGINLEGMKVYPNPAKEHFTLSINLKQATELKITLYSSSGRISAEQVLSYFPAGNHHINQDLENLTAGMYTLVVRDIYNGDVYRTKLIVFGN